MRGVLDICITTNLKEGEMYFFLNSTAHKRLANNDSVVEKTCVQEISLVVTLSTDQLLEERAPIS